MDETAQVAQPQKPEKPASLRFLQLFYLVIGLAAPLIFYELLSILSKSLPQGTVVSEVTINMDYILVWLPVSLYFLLISLGMFIFTKISLKLSLLGVFLAIILLDIPIIVAITTFFNNQCWGSKPQPTSNGVVAFMIGRIDTDLCSRMPIALGLLFLVLLIFGFSIWSLRKGLRRLD